MQSSWVDLLNANWMICIACIQIHDFILLQIIKQRCTLSLTACFQNDEMAFRGWRLFGLAGTIFVYVAGILLLSIISLQNSSQRRPRIRSLNDVSDLNRSVYIVPTPINNCKLFLPAGLDELPSSRDDDFGSAQYFEVVSSLDLCQRCSHEESDDSEPSQAVRNVSRTPIETQHGRRNKQDQTSTRRKPDKL